MTILEQQQVAATELLGRDLWLAGESGVSRHRHHGRGLKETFSLEGPPLVGQSQQHDVELALLQLLDQTDRQILDQIKLELSIGAAEAREDTWQEKGADRRNDSHPQHA